MRLAYNNQKYMCSLALLYILLNIHQAGWIIMFIEVNHRTKEHCRFYVEK